MERRNSKIKGVRSVSDGTRFYGWLLRQKRRDDPVGDLANDAVRDESFPKHEPSLEGIRSHLRLRNACVEASCALNEAWYEFKSVSKRRKSISCSRRFEIFRRDDFRCQMCGMTVQDGARLEVDHKVPVAGEGSDEESNLWTLCFKCNRGKGSLDLGDAQSLI